MAKKDHAPTQKTQPRGKDKATGEPHEPIDIPVPKRKDVFGIFEKVAEPAKGSKTSDE